MKEDKIKLYASITFYGLLGLSVGSAFVLPQVSVVLSIILAVIMWLSIILVLVGSAFFTFYAYKGSVDFTDKKDKLLEAQSKMNKITVPQATGGFVTVLGLCILGYYFTALMYVVSIVTIRLAVNNFVKRRIVE